MVMRAVQCLRVPMLITGDTISKNRDIFSDTLESRLWTGTAGGNASYGRFYGITDDLKTLPGHA